MVVLIFDLIWLLSWSIFLQRSSSGVEPWGLSIVEHLPVLFVSYISQSYLYHNSQSCIDI